MEISRRAFLAAIPAALAITLLYVYENYREVLCLAGRCPPSTSTARTAASATVTPSTTQTAASTTTTASGTSAGRGLVLPASLPGTISFNGGVVLSDDAIAFQLTPGQTGDYAVLLQDGVLRTLPEDAVITPNRDYSNITGSQIVNGLYFFGGGEEAPAPWSPCAVPCAPYISVYDGSALKILKIPSGSCDNMNFTGAAYDGELYYAFGGANAGSETGGTGVAVLGPDLSIRAMNGLSFYDDAGNFLNMYRSGPKQYRSGRIYTLAYNGGKLFLESVKLPIPNAGRICFQQNIAPRFEALVATDFNASAIPVLADDLSVAYFNGSEVVHKAADGEVLERVKVPNPQGNVYIKVVNGVLVAANQDGCVFKVLAPVQKEFRGLGFVDWRGYAAVFASCSLSSGTPVELAPLL